MSRRHRGKRKNTNHYEQKDTNGQRQDSCVKRSHASDQKKHKSYHTDTDKPGQNEQIDRSVVTEELDELKIQRVLDELEKQMDKEYMMAGKVVAEIFRLVYLASLKLPDMELHTDMIDVIKNLKHTTVIIHHAFIENRDDTSHRSGIYMDSFNISHEPGKADDDFYSIGNYDEDKEDDEDIDEEGWIYDAD